MVIEPSPLGLSSVIVSSSLFSTDQPLGTSTFSLEFDSVPLPPDEDGVAVGEGSGDGEPAGLGLDSDLKLDAVWVFLPNVVNASTVPHPAMITTRPTIAAMMIIHGVRWTGGCIPPPDPGV